MNGIISWFARNGVAANLLVAFIIFAGIYGLQSIKREIFPQVESDLVSVSVEYLGAAPEEVEEGVCVRIEEAIQGLEDIKHLTSTADEGRGSVVVELLPGADVASALDEIKARVDAIDTFPEEAEKPVIQEIQMRKQVINVAIAGEVDEAILKRIGERVRDELAALPKITQVELSNVRPYEISIEVSENDLRKYGLTFDQVANAVRQSSLDLPGGSVKTEGGEILLRTKGQAYRGEEFEAITLVTRNDGTRLTVGDVARVVDGFAETDQESSFDGMNGVLVQVFRIGDENPLEISDAVYEYVRVAQTSLPEGILLTTWQDDSTYLKGRQQLLLKNGLYGLVLVFLTLALFLRIGLAGWVSFGLGVSFLGTLSVLPMLDVSINLLSLFAFILVLGIVVDDAIVVAENIHTHQEQHEGNLDAAIHGAQEVSKPVIFAVLTTVVAFLPLAFAPGPMGKIMKVIPLVVIPTLLFSLVESLLVLPNHLTHTKVNGRQHRGIIGAWERFQNRFETWLVLIVKNFYRPWLDRALEWRYLTVAIAVSLLLITMGMIGGGWFKYQFFPEVEGDNVAAIVTLPLGTPVEETRAVVRNLEAEALKLREEIDGDRAEGEPSIFRHVLSSVGSQPFHVIQQMSVGRFVEEVSNSHLGEVHIELTASEERGESSSQALADRWRTNSVLGPAALSLEFTAALLTTGDPIDVQLTGPDFTVLRQAADALKLKLASYPGVFDIADNFQEGKEEVKLNIKPSAEAIGLTKADLGRQVRQAFYGEEAQRIQRGRDEVRVMVRYPKEERRSLGDLEQMRIRVTAGVSPGMAGRIEGAELGVSQTWPSIVEVPFSEVAEVVLDRGYSTIKRVDRQRAINVKADVDSKQATASQIISDLNQNYLADFKATYPSVSVNWEGQRREQQDTVTGIIRTYPLAMLIVYALLAIPFRSYLQPLIVMSAIPFGLVGAAWAHFLLGMDMTIMSTFGIVALSGVVVNDNLVLVVFINRYRDKGGRLIDAAREAGVARFRPILLTSLTTFVGLMPLILEKSVQAKFLIPMAVSLAFGVLFATAISLILVPAGYLILEDVKNLWREHTATAIGPDNVEPSNAIGREQDVVAKESP